MVQFTVVQFTVVQFTVVISLQWYSLQLCCRFDFRHAGAYSSEEVIRIMRDKLIRLQKLYIDQFQRLRYLLKEERRAYRMATKKEQVQVIFHL